MPAYLKWISNADLEAAVRHVMQAYKASASERTLAKFTKNIIDPFTMLFELELPAIDAMQWAYGEVSRQSQKSLSNTIGEFHQKILGKCTGWQDLGIGHITGYDLRNQQHTVFAEIKNKYNTLNGKGKVDLHGRMIRDAQRFPDRTYYYVTIINPPGRFNKVWDYQGTTNERVRHIDGATFYAYVSQHEAALRELYSAIPNVLNSLWHFETTDKWEGSKLYSELIKINGHETTNRYALARYFFLRAFPSLLEDIPLQ